MSESFQLLAASIRWMQFFTGNAAIASTLVTVALAVLRLIMGNPPAVAPFDTYALLAGFITFMKFADFVPELVRNYSLKQLASSETAATPDHLVRLMQASLIIRVALLGAATFCCAIAYYIDGIWWVLLWAAVGIASILWMFPTEKNALKWLDAAGQKLREFQIERKTELQNAPRT